MEVNENCEMGTVVGTLSAEDVDVGQSLTYSLSDTSNLVVEGNKVKVTGSIDFEQMPSITFKATATDDGQPPKTVSVIVEVKAQDKVMNFQHAVAEHDRKIINDSDSLHNLVKYYVFFRFPGFSQLQ